MRVAVHQPNYAPWCGYFAKLFDCDAFIFFDDVQLPQGRSYVTRTRIAQGRDGETWLTVPVSKSGRPSIDRVTISDPQWAEKHLRTLRHTYARTTCVEEVLDLVTPVYEAAGERVGEFNMSLIRAVAGYLGWSGTFYRSSDNPSELKADARIAELVQGVGGTVYVSGAGGENYQSAETYAERAVELEVRAFAPVEYERSGWPFVPGLSCLDALFHTGARARHAMTYTSASND